MKSVITFQNIFIKSIRLETDWLRDSAHYSKRHFRISKRVINALKQQPGSYQRHFDINFKLSCKAFDD